MIKHPDTDVQFIIEVLEGQRDSATVQSAAFFQENLKLKQEIEALKGELNAQKGNIGQDAPSEH